GGPWHARVKAIVDSSDLAGAQPAVIADINRYQEVVGRGELFNIVLVANQGGLNSVERSEQAAQDLRVALVDREAAKGLFEIMQTPAAQQTMIEIERALDGTTREEFVRLRLEASRGEMTDRFVSAIS